MAYTVLFEGKHGYVAIMVAAAHTPWYYMVPLCWYYMVPLCWYYMVPVIGTIDEAVVD
jgi:hypothetical protein